MRRFLLWLVVLFILFYIFTNPASAATVVESVLNFLRTAAGSVVTFFEQLVS
jgi:uncharacterized membrane protein